VEDGTMREPKTKEIGGIQFSVTPFQATEAFRLKAYLFKKFAPAVGELSGIMKDGLPKNGKFGDLKIDPQVITQTIEKLVGELGEDDFISLIRRLLKNVGAKLTLDGKPAELYFTEETFETSLDLIFGGKTFSLYPVLLFVLEANYPDFFGMVAGNIGGKIKAMVTSDSPGKESKEK
jgi:hypothetical protein